MGYPFPRINFQGLDRMTQYRVTPISESLAKETPAISSGRLLMGHGVEVDLRGDMQAAALKFKAQ
ncbi:GH36 C-terminal domain-containing protein [Tunturiibacter lichenicola]|uniref:GH36 C-terminal domain-containing protein n=1 Tax=Tunturiibacter lichenicola TaxID=2051959 RepID=UPI0036F2F15A